MKIGVIADIHEDIVALKAALALLEQAGCTELICLGDITGFKVNTYHYLDTRNAHECIALVRANCRATVIGNNDLYQIKKLPHYPAGFDFPANWYELDFYERKALAGNQLFLYEDVQLNALLTKTDTAWLESLPDVYTGEYAGLRILFSHFAYPDLHGLRTYFPKRAEEFQEHLGFIGQHGCTLGISGHMHFEGLSRVSETGLRRQDFGSYPFSRDLQYWYGPCVARGQFNNGFLVIDTAAATVEAVPL
ncbi:MAG TPA: metallophosphoesterase [Puia sp.]|jgi:predicted phosphodiesterase|nr:metallophosphoesterase [Puia sp.]